MNAPRLSTFRPPGVRFEPRAIHPAVAQFYVAVSTWSLVVYSGVHGVNILVAGVKRWGGQSYLPAIPGAPGSWGLLLVVFGAVATVGLWADRSWLTVAGMTLIGIWHTFFALTFAIAAVAFETAVSTAHWVYGLVAVLSFILAGVHQSGRAAGFS